MVRDTVYFKKSQNYVNFRFETEEEATAFRHMCRLFGIKTDIFHGEDKNYKRSVYINEVEYRD